MADGKGTDANTPPEVPSESPGIRPWWWDLAALVSKLVVVAAAVAVVFTQVFGVARISNADMSPAVKAGDVVFWYRLDDSVDVSEVVAVSYGGSVHLGRVVAREGDVVNIDRDGLVVNGSHQVEVGIYEDTTQVADGVTFPLTVPDGAVFVLGDARMSAVDSRIYGCVGHDDLLGVVVAQFRRRGF